jgi:hypothetical protein
VLARREAARRIPREIFGARRRGAIDRWHGGAFAARTAGPIAALEPEDEGEARNVRCGAIAASPMPSTREIPSPEPRGARVTSCSRLDKNMLSG